MILLGAVDAGQHHVLDVVLHGVHECLRHTPFKVRQHRLSAIELDHLPGEERRVGAGAGWGPRPDGRPGRRRRGRDRRTLAVAPCQAGG